MHYKASALKVPILWCVKDHNDDEEKTRVVWLKYSSFVNPPLLQGKIGISPCGTIHGNNHHILLISLHQLVRTVSFFSTAIMRYICQKYDLSDHWYPADINKRARIDEYLSWHHTNTRLAAMEILWAKVLN